MTKQSPTSRSAVSKKTVKKSASAKAVTKVPTISKKAVRLLGMHTILALVYAIQAGLILFLSSSHTISVAGSFLAQDSLQSSLSQKTVYAAAHHHLFDLNLVYLVVGFLLIAAIAHLLIALITTRTSLSAVAKIELQRNVRWLGIGISGVVVSLTLGLVVGLHDVGALAGLAGLTAIVAVAGYVLETGSRVQRRVLYSFAAIAAAMPWLILGSSVVLASIYGNLTMTVQWIFVVAFCLAALLYVGVYNLYASRRPLKLEASVFTSLVILAMYSALAWQVYAGLLKV